MITPCYYPVKGGTETVVRNLSMELNRIGVHTDVMTFNMDRKYAPKWRGKIEKIEGITVFKIPALNWLPIEHSPKITLDVNLIPGRFANLLKEYNIIHFHELDFSFPLFSFFVRKPKIFHLHGIDVNFLKKYHLNRVILKHVADYYISITRQMERDLVELGISRSRIMYLPNAVNGELFRPHGGKEDNLLLFVGRISFEKGLHVLLDSLRDLKKSVSLVIIGPATSLNYYKDILKRIEKENQRGKHRITYLGALDQPEVAKWCQKASILILPSFYEAFPVVILEALSCETPVIATPVGGIPELVRDYENGFLIPPNNPLKLAEAIEYLLDNKDIRIKMGKAGRKRGVKDFSLEVVAQKLRRVYEQIITTN